MSTQTVTALAEGGAHALLEVEGLRKEFAVRRRKVVRAVSNVSFTIQRGETFALVGESGCGKSTVGRLITGIESITEGCINLDGLQHGKHGANRKEISKRVQIVFQDPYSSLNPRRTILQSVSEPAIRLLGLSRREANARVYELLDLVGLDRSVAARYPHEFSGGQRQRICIARALVVDPELIILDEPLSALDVSLQAQIIDLLRVIQERTETAFLFISHDLSVVRDFSSRVAVMYLGRIVESGNVEEVFGAPRHPYTRGLLASVPAHHPSQRLDRSGMWDGVKGDLPDPANPPSGCPFRTRCPIAQEVCASAMPPLDAVDDVGAPHRVACYFPVDPERPESGPVAAAESAPDLDSLGKES